MTVSSHASPEDPRHLLAATREWTRSVRRDQGEGWFALLVFGVVTLLAAPFFRYGTPSRHCASQHGGPAVCTVYPTLALWYWPVALLIGYVAIGWFYVRRSRGRGVGSRVQPYLAVGVLVGLLAAVWLGWSLAHPAFLAESLRPGSSETRSVIYRLTSPAGALGLALLVLAWIERAWLMAAVAVVYLAAVTSGVNHRSTHPSRWDFLPHLLLTAGVLLVGAGVLALVRLASRQRPA